MTETTDSVKMIKEKAFVQVRVSLVGCGGWVVLAQYIYISEIYRTYTGGFFFSCYIFIFIFIFSQKYLVILSVQCFFVCFSV